MKLYALLVDGSIRRARQLDESNTALIQLAESKGYKEVVQPPLNDNQVAGDPYINGNVITFQIVDKTAQEIWQEDHDAWSSELEDYRQALPDSVEWLIKSLVQKGVLTVNDIPLVLKQTYQNKVAHRNNEPVQP